MIVNEDALEQLIRAYVASPPGGPPHSEVIPLAVPHRAVLLSHIPTGTHKAESYSAQQLHGGEPYGPVLTVRPDNGPDGVSTTRKAFGDDEQVVKLIVRMVRAVADL